MKTFFIPCVYGYANKGDWALFESLKKILKEQYHDCKIYAVCKNAELQSKKIPDVNWIEQLGSSNQNGLLRKILIIMGYIKMTILYIFYPVVNSKYTNALKEADIIITCPGGYLHDANYSIFTLLVNLTLAIRSKKNIILAPQSIGPINNKYFRYLTIKMLKYANAIFVREHFSYLYCISSLNCPESKIYEVMDMAFYDNEYLWPNIIDIPKSKKYVACTLIKWLYPNMSNKDLLYEKYLKELAGYFEFVIKQLHYDIVVLKQIEKFGAEKGDEQIFEDIKPFINPQIIDSVHFIYQETTYMEMKGILKYATFFVGSRMHSNIFAIQQGTPVIAVSYQPKTDYIMSSLGLSKYSFPINNLCKEKLISATYELLSSLVQKTQIIEKESKRSRNIFIDKIKSLL